MSFVSFKVLYMLAFSGSRDTTHICGSANLPKLMIIRIRVIYLWCNVTMCYWIVPEWVVYVRYVRDACRAEITNLRNKIRIHLKDEAYDRSTDFADWILGEFCRVWVGHKN
jgi:hypothetical protein